MKFIKYLYGFICARTSVKKNLVYFSSFYGLYNDNPKYISEKLHDFYPDIEIVWERAKRSNEQFPDYVKVVKVGSFRSFRYIAKARIVVDNGAGYYYFAKTHKLAFILNRLINKKGVNISTWHGTPFKKIGFDIPNYSIKPGDLRSSSRVLFAGSDYEYNIFTKCFNGYFEIVKIGNPRNDILLSKADKEMHKEKINLPKDKKIVMYCPTFRDSVEDSGVVQINMMDINKLCEVLKEKFGGEWAFVFRGHQMVYERIVLEDSGNIINGNLHDDMADYLLCSDVIITDYSGSLFDVCLTDKPCFLFAHDSNKYINKDRGSYLSLNQLPFSFSNTFDELLLNIKLFDREKYIKKTKLFNRYLRTYNDGNSSKRAVEYIVNKMGE